MLSELRDCLLLTLGWRHMEQPELILGGGFTYTVGPQCIVQSSAEVYDSGESNLTGTTGTVGVDYLNGGAKQDHAQRGHRSQADTTCTTNLPIQSDSHTSSTFPRGYFYSWMHPWVLIVLRAQGLLHMKAYLKVVIKNIRTQTQSSLPQSDSK